MKQIVYLSCNLLSFDPPLRIYHRSQSLKIISLCLQHVYCIELEYDVKCKYLRPSNESLMCIDIITLFSVIILLHLIYFNCCYFHCIIGLMRLVALLLHLLEPMRNDISIQISESNRCVMENSQANRLMRLFQANRSAPSAVDDHLMKVGLLVIGSNMYYIYQRKDQR